jgi:signal transduction histidine kinase
LEVPAEKVHTWTHGITRAAEYMLNIIGNLLDINKIEAGKVEMVIERVEASIVELIADAYNYRAVEKDLTMLVEQFAGDAAFLADHNALQQVFENLISNAIKFSPKGTNIIVRVKPSNHHLRIEIQDEGQGISADDMTKLFGKFARLTAQPTGGEHSTGLGLSIVKKMVEAMNGRVWCESEVGKGATFIVELPRVEETVTKS